MPNGFDPNSAIPLDSAEQLRLLRETNNGVHPLDPPQEDETGEEIKHQPYPFRLMTQSRMATLSVQQRVLNMAKSQLGYHEDSKGDSKFGIWYGDQPSVNSSGYDGASWCDMFVCWCLYQIGGQEYLDVCGEYAYTPWHAAYLHGKGVTDRSPQPGDIAFQNWDLNGTGNSNLDKIDHVEFAETVHGDGTVTYVGGNVGDAVKRTRRSMSYLVVVAHWWKLLPAASAPTDDPGEVCMIYA